MHCNEVTFQGRMASVDGIVQNVDGLVSWWLRRAKAGGRGFQYSNLGILGDRLSQVISLFTSQRKKYLL